MGSPLSLHYVGIFDTNPKTNKKKHERNKFTKNMNHEGLSEGGTKNLVVRPLKKAPSLPV